MLAGLLLVVGGVPGVALGAGTSATVSQESMLKLPVKIKTRQIQVSVSPEMELTLPDGDTRLVVESDVKGRKVQVGTRYNFIFGKIRYWLGYSMPLVVEPALLQMSVSDEIGFGRVYFNERFLERARNGRVGIGYRFAPVTVLGAVGRTSWRLAPFDSPTLEQVGLIDFIDAQITTGRLLPRAFGPVVPDDSSASFQHAFRGLGGDYHYDRIEVHLSWLFGSSRPGDELRVRARLGEGYNGRPELPVRATFALGGVASLKGYRYEEFRGNGVLFLSAEHGWQLPWLFEYGLLGLKLEKCFVLGFVEGGRIEADWFKPATPWKWSTGVGMQLVGRVLQRYQGGLRLYIAQAEGVSHRSPVFYVTADVK